MVTAVVMAGVSSVFALLGELESTYGLPVSGLGWIAGAAFAAALVTQLTLARYADRGHGALLLWAGTASAALGLLWFALSTELWQFVCARALLGAGIGMLIPPARRIIVVTSDGDQGERLGIFYGAYLSGFVFGPPFAALLTELTDVRVPFVVLGVLTAVSMLTLRGLEVPEATPTAATALMRRGVLRRLLASREVIAALLVIVSFRYSVGVFEPLWAVFLGDMGASTALIGLSLTMFALPMLLVARRAGSLSDRYGPRAASVWSAAATVPLMASYGIVGVLPAVLAMSIPHGLLEAIQSPGTQAALADAAPRDDAAAAQGLGEAAGSAASGIGALTAAPLFAYLGAGPAWFIAGVAMAVLLALSAVLDRPVVRPRPAGTATGAPATEPA